MSTADAMVVPWVARWTGEYVYQQALIQVSVPDLIAPNWGDPNPSLLVAKQLLVRFDPTPRMTV